MSLATVQRGLSELVRTGTTTSTDPYVRGLTGSERVDLLREIVLLWRTFGVQRACPMTSRLLSSRGRLERAVDEFVAGNSRKFWEVEVAGKDMTTRWGRIGSAGQSKTKTFADASAARAAADKLIAEKTGDGYVEVAASASGPKTR